MLNVLTMRSDSSSSSREVAATAVKEMAEPRAGVGGGTGAAVGEEEEGEADEFGAEKKSIAVADVWLSLVRRCCDSWKTCWWICSVDSSGLSVCNDGEAE